MHTDYLFANTPANLPPLTWIRGEHRSIEGAERSVEGRERLTR